jgi:glycosyltransferase involved in cell wall biosynthesis
MSVIAYVYRSKESGFSIENVFFNLSAEVSKQLGITIRAAFAPYRVLSIKNIINNLLFAYTQRTQDAIYHITGETHYLSLMLPPNRTILTIHDCVSLDRQQKAGNTIQYWLLWVLYYYLPMRRAVYITTVSEKSRHELIRHMGCALAAKVQVIPNFYNPAYKHSPKNFNQDCPKFLHVGTAPHKNLKRLIQAIEGLTCRLIIVGTLGSEEFTELTKRGIDYDHHTHVAQEQLISLYQQCDVVVFVSLYEGFGLPILEAQAVGRPVLTSSISPMIDVGGNGACYVDPTNVDAIRQGILGIWQNAAYRDGLVQEGKLNVANYSLPLIAKAYMALYQKVMNNE